MAKIKTRKKKKGEPEWLAQCRLAKQREYDRKKAKQPVRVDVSSYPTVGNLWPEAFDERENLC